MNDNDIKSRDWLTEGEANSYIGNNSTYYMQKWDSHSDSTFKGLNFAAFFVPLEWMAYRKMYAEAILCYSAGVIILIGVDFLLGMSGADGRGIGSVFKLLIGIFGNTLYRKKALRVLHKTNNMNDLERIGYLRDKGGVSVAACIICLIIEFIIVFI